ncbi:hypothetical protein FA95DRAFT_1473557, partial [Auriscalpium vulgare]
ELYDSGTTRHISPYREDFVNFRDVAPKTFQAANQGSFSASGAGDLVIEVPNGTDISELTL